MSQSKSLFARLGVAAWGIPLIILVIYFGGAIYALFIALVAGIALYEFYSIAETRHLAPQTSPAVLLAAIAVFSAQYLPAGCWISLMLLLAILLVFIEIRFGERRGLRDVPVTIFGWIYIPLLLGTLIYVRNAVWNDLERSPIYTLYLFSAIWICDTAAYVGGKLIGRHKLAPYVSPKKTWEGFIFGILGAFFWAYLWIPFLVGKTDTLDPYYVALIVGTIGQLGDLVESYFKRSAGVKDSSNLLPEHGGALDRFDSLILAAPFVFIYLLAAGRIELF